MPDESKTNNATPASEKVGAANLQQMNASELRQLIAKAQLQESKKVEEEKKQLQSNFQREAKKLGYSVDVAWSDLPIPEPEIKRPKKSKGKAPAKYRGPNGEEWAGRGRPTKWLVELEAAGHKREEFIILQE